MSSARRAGDGDRKEYKDRDSQACESRTGQNFEGDRCRIEWASSIRWIPLVRGAPPVSHAVGKIQKLPLTRRQPVQPLHLEPISAPRGGFHHHEALAIGRSDLCDFVCHNTNHHGKELPSPTRVAVCASSRRTRPPAVDAEVFGSPVSMSCRPHLVSSQVLSICFAADEGIVGATGGPEIL